MVPLGGPQDAIERHRTALPQALAASVIRPVCRSARSPPPPAAPAPRPAPPVESGDVLRGRLRVARLDAAPGSTKPGPEGAGRSWSCRRPGGTDDAGRRERTEPDTKSLRGAMDLGDHGVNIGDRMAAQLHRVDNGHAGATNIDHLAALTRHAAILGLQHAFWAS